MMIEIRIYKQFDTDLLALCDAGYPIRKMLKQAVTSYANGTPCHFYMDEIIPFDPGNKQTIHARFDVPESDSNTIYMLKHIHRRYRNTFCKAVLRNAIIQQDISAFFTDPALFQLQNINMQSKGFYSFQNIIPLSTLREEKAVQFDDKKYVRNTGTPVAKVSVKTINTAQTESHKVMNYVNQTEVLKVAPGQSPSKPEPVFTMPQITSVQMPSDTQIASMPTPQTVAQNIEAPSVSSSAVPVSQLSNHSEPYIIQPPIPDTSDTLQLKDGVSDDEELMKIFDNL